MPLLPTLLGINAAPGVEHAVAKRRYIRVVWGGRSGVEKQGNTRPGVLTSMFQCRCIPESDHHLLPFCLVTGTRCKRKAHRWPTYLKVGTEAWTVQHGGHDVDIHSFALLIHPLPSCSFVLFRVPLGNHQHGSRVRSGW